MMAPPASRDRETRDLIQQYKARESRRRRTRLVAALLGVVVVLGLAAAVVVLVIRGPAENGGTAFETSTPATIIASDEPRSSTTLPLTGGPVGDTTQGMGDLAEGPSTSVEPVTTAASTTTTAPTTSTAPTTTTLRATTTSASPSITAAPAKPTGLVVVIDPGHQAKGDYNTEPVGPGSSNVKAKVSSGTAGIATGTPESELVLAVALKLRDSLVSHGVQVVMTRTTQDVNISNIQRAQIANEAGADLFVRIHADGSDNPAVAGIHTLYPASIKGWTDDIASASKQAATLAQQELIAATGAKDRGLDARSDISGFNWSDVPVILPEIGFMTNADEDRKLATAAYQDKIVQGLTRAILSFLGMS